MEKQSTELRYIRSKDIDLIIRYINVLPYMVELKGGITRDGKKYLQSFVLPEDLLTKEIPSGDLD